MLLLRWMSFLAGGKVSKEWKDGKLKYTYKKGKTSWIQLKKYFGIKHNFSDDVKKMLSGKNQSEELFDFFKELNGYLSSN